LPAGRRRVHHGPGLPVRRRVELLPGLPGLPGSQTHLLSATRLGLTQVF